MSTDTDLPVQDELAVLKHRADVMGLKYHPSIGKEALKEKINTAMSEAAPMETEIKVQPKESEHARRKRLIEEASKLIRIRVTCMNPAKKEYEGELFTAGNSVVGSYTKYIPFNVDDGWHVPNIIFKEIRARQCQVFQTKTDHRGNKYRQGTLIKEFAVEVLPQLTEVELQELAQRQAMSKAID